MTTSNDTAPFVRGLVLAGVLYAIAFVVLSVGGHVRSLLTVDDLRKEHNSVTAI